MATEGVIVIPQVRNGSGSAGDGEEMSQQDLLGLDVGSERRQGCFEDSGRLDLAALPGF